MNNKTPLLSKGQVIDNKYSITFFLKKGSYAESYRVNEYGRTKILKLFLLSKLHRTQFDINGNVLEIEVLKQLKHPNIVTFYDTGNVVIEKQKYEYVIADFISGETLSEKLKREQVYNPIEAKEIMLGILNGIKFLHNQPDPIIHNDLTTSNVMLDLSGRIPVPKIIDFGYARFLSQSHKDFQKEGLNPYFTANEAFNNIFSIKSDIFSLGALYYQILVGLPPWFIEIPKINSDRTKFEDILFNERKKPLKVLNTDSKIDELTFNIITKALQTDAANRFNNIDEFIQAINGEIVVENPKQNNVLDQTSSIKHVKLGDGFSSIAGMQELKDTIKLDVIDAILNPEEYKKDNLGIPNGMLLYGPPGCGKTFFAEKMAEEIGFNFYQIKPSDIQSKWVNASQENIKNLFEEARKNAPSIIFLDELDALVPSRDNTGVNHMNTSAVNEFLAQMNNSGDDGVFIIGATNRPQSIDSAILRSGRLDKHIYLPPPDFEARKALFELYLKAKKTIDLGINYDHLANLTKNYSSSDIKLITDEASRKRIKDKLERLTMDILEFTIDKSKPSISVSDLDRYNEIKSKMDGQQQNNNDRPKIGF